MADKTALDEAVERQYKGLSFDELNALYDDEKDHISTDYDEWFDDMDLTEAQKQDRKETAEELERIFRDLLALVFYLYVEGAYEYAEAMTEAQQQYLALLDKASHNGVNVSDYYRNIHVPVKVSEVVNTMLEHPENPWNFTIDRAMAIAENEANSMWNNADFQEALASGKTRKWWDAIIDGKTRDWHAEANGQTKPIWEPFEVNGELLQYPMDDSYGATGSNINHCRCVAKYL